MPRQTWSLCIALSLFAGGVAAQNGEEADLASVYGGADFVTIATGGRQPLAQAPAAATVVTAEDIKAIGATELNQVLETVPGFHTAISGPGYNPVYIIRGIFTSEQNPQVLVLINGIPITNLFAGNRSQGWGGMPVQDISRIEIIRGPGSALYGADAYAGTINIVTKTADEIPGLVAGVRAGSFNSREAWLQHGTNVGELSSAFSLELSGTDGFRKTVESDLQTAFDAGPGKASLAPGPVNTQVDRVDARGDLGWRLWRLRMGYQGRRNIGTGVGGAQALDPVGKVDADRINGDLTYDNPNFAPNWDVSTQLSYFESVTRSDLILFPPGAFGFPDGVIGNPYVYERHYRLGTSAFYTGIADHRLRFGAGLTYGDMYRIRETKNFSLGPGGFPPMPLGGLQDVSDSAPFIRPHNRRARYLFAQDEWAITSDWHLTAGVRYDNYSDFGSTTNPRLALVWQARHDLTAKVLYGRAFRAPSFAELYNINNPVALGNPALKPETINTAELAFDYQPVNRWRTSLSVFQYTLDDIIRFVPDPAPASSATARNSGSQVGHGFEWEVSWEARKNLRLSGNYAFQRATDKRTDTAAANAPQQQIYLRADWQVQPHWTLNTQAKWIADRKRAAGDSRPPIGDYTLVDVTARYRPLRHHLSFAFSVRNIFNQDAREPSLAPGFVPNDLPLAGRSFYLQASYGD